MNLPKVVAELVKTQNNFDSIAYAKCFTETAVVFDEGKTHNGRKEIEHWIADANERYQSTMEPISYEENRAESILKAEVSGTFPGSPLVLYFHLKLKNDLIESLKTTS